MAAEVSLPRHEPFTVFDSYSHSLTNALIFRNRFEITLDGEQKLLYLPFADEAQLNYAVRLREEKLTAEDMIYKLCRLEQTSAGGGRGNYNYSVQANRDIRV